jgi:hypothetical protein
MGADRPFFGRYTDIPRKYLISRADSLKYRGLCQGDINISGRRSECRLSF